MIVVWSERILYSAHYGKSDDVLLCTYDMLLRNTCSQILDTQG